VSTSYLRTTPTPRQDRPGDLCVRLEALRAQLAEGKPDDVAQRLLSKVCEAVERLHTEHTGMAEELLGVYEQLGIIFEVTGRLSTVQTESGVVDLFVDSLRRSAQGRDVLAVEPGALSGEVAGSPQHYTNNWFGALLRQARDRRSVVVEAPPEGSAAGPVSEALIGPVYAGDSFVCAIALTRGPDAKPFRASDMLLLESLTRFCGDVICTHRLVREVREMSIAMVRSLVNAVDQKDQYTSGHSLRVGYFAILLGKALGLDEAALQMLQWSALLHDVGKIGIRDDVLKKPGRLTGKEFDHVKEHPVRSYEVVQGVPQLARAVDGVLHHHEHYDGSGYPAGLAGQDIPLQARIIQIADVFDALTSNRAYRAAYDWRKALEIMKREAGRTVDPEMQEVFSRLMHNALDGTPDGWKRMVERADRFTQVAEEEASGSAGE